MSPPRVLALAIALVPTVAPCLASDELEIAHGRVFGHFIDDEGRVILGTTHGGSNFQAQLVFWTRTEAKTLDVDYGGKFPILFKNIQASAEGGDTFILRGAMKVDDSDHGALVQQAYRLKSSGRLQQLWSNDTSRWISDGVSIDFSPDGAMWGGVSGRLRRVAPNGKDKQLHFAFGRTKSRTIRRTETLTFEQEPHRDAYPDFLFLSSDGPVLLVPYADDYHLLRFTDFGADVQRIDQLRPVRAAYGASMHIVIWQPEDRVLWGNDGQEWAAWDLWDLALSGFPDEPFLRLESSSGEPHRVRGFVSKTVTDRGYRIEHLWQSPRIEHLNERYASDWRPGKPVSVSVSPNGQYAVALEEVRENKDGETEIRQVLRRFELALELPPPPPPTGRDEAH